MAESATGKIIGTVVAIGGAYALYAWLKSQCSTPGSMLGASSLCSGFNSIFGPATATVTGTSAPATPAQPPAGPPPVPIVPPPQSFSPANPGPTPVVPVLPAQPAPPPPLPSNTTSGAVNHLAGQLLAAAGASPTTMMNVDQWGYYWAEPAVYGSPIDPGVLTQAFPWLTNATRGSMTAQQFATAVAGAMGLSGLGEFAGLGFAALATGGHSIPAWMVHDCPGDVFSQLVHLFSQCGGKPPALPTPRMPYDPNIPTSPCNAPNPPAYCFSPAHPGPTPAPFAPIPTGPQTVPAGFVPHIIVGQIPGTHAMAGLGMIPLHLIHRQYGRFA